MKSITTNTSYNIEYAKFISTIDWTLYSTLTYKNHITPKRNTNIMTQLSEKLKTNFPVKTIFWIGEYHKNMHSVHTHMLIETKEPDKVKQYIDYIWKRYYGFPKTKPYIKEYNALFTDTTDRTYKTGSGCPFYVTKFIDHPYIDYDLVI